MFVQTVPGQTSTKVKMTVFIWQTVTVQMFVQNDSLHMAQNSVKAKMTVFIWQTVPAQTSMKVKMTVFITGCYSV